MKKTILAFASCMTLLVGVAFAQNDHDLSGWMKTIGGANGGLRKAVAAKDVAAAIANADKLAATFKMVQAHFEEHHMEDGVKFAQTAHNSAMNVAAAAKAGEWDKASDELKTIGGQCQGCHSAHREKQADGSFRMK